MIKKVVRLEVKTMIVRIPILECGHRSRSIKGRCKKSYYCAVCVAKQAREDERNKKDVYFEGD